MHELLGQGPVQAQFLANDLHGGLVGVHARGQAGGIARQHVDEQEHQYRHDQQRGKQPQQSFEEIVQHDAAPRCAARGKTGAEREKGPPLSAGAVHWAYFSEISSLLMLPSGITYTPERRLAWA